MNLTKEEKASWLLFIAGWVIYAIISMTKSAYAASMASIIAEGLFNKSQAGTINASFYLFYGAAQLAGVKVVDRISPIKLVAITLMGTLISTVGMALSKGFLMMLIFWSFCGLIQFAIWPAILRIISEYLVPNQRNKAMFYIAFSYCAGMLTNYVAAGIVLSVANWQMLFWAFSIILMLSIALWYWVTYKTKDVYTRQAKINQDLLDKESKTKDNARKKKGQIGFVKLITVSGIVILLIPSFIRTAMDAGLKLWVPTMITENYGVSASFANILTSILVFVNLGGVYIAYWIHSKWTRNVAWAFGICFLVALPFTSLLLLMGKVTVGVIVLLLTVITTMMYAGHQIINVIVPSNFSRYNRAGSIAALLNAIASFGSVASNIGFGYIAEHFGWNATIISWIVLVVIALLACVAAVPVWTKFTKR